MSKFASKKGGRRDSLSHLKRRIVGGVALFVAAILLLLRKPDDYTGALEGFSVSKSSSLRTSSSNTVNTDGNHKRLWTIGEMRNAMRLPCNYVHDGFYLSASNEMLNQVYLSMMQLLDDNDKNKNNDDIVPIIIEVGGHDGITKSLTLKSSICFHMNTLLIEASPNNYKTLSQARAYDFTVNRALCSKGTKSVTMMEHAVNSGMNKIMTEQNKDDSSTSYQKRVEVLCTTIDDELDKLKATLPTHLQDKLQLMLLILDVEGYELTAIDGLQKYSPQKAFIESKSQDEEGQAKINAWAKHHGMLSSKSFGHDVGYNFHPPVKPKRALFYGARNAVPERTAFTSEASKAYMYYGT